MNVNTLRKNYESLTYIERNALFISALQRGDQSEIDAIYMATPRKTVREIDFYDLKQSLFTLQMYVIIEKVNHFNIALILSEAENPKHEGAERLSLYLFFIVADAWREVCKGIGVDADAFEKMLFRDQPFIYRIADVESAFRDIAFNEAEATAFCKKFDHFDGALAFTLKKKVAEFRKFLDLPDK